MLKIGQLYRLSGVGIFWGNTKLKDLDNHLIHLNEGSFITYLGMVDNYFHKFLSSDGVVYMTVNCLEEDIYNFERVWTIKSC